MFPKVTFRQTNAFAMQYGAVMGVWGLVANACFVGSFSVPGLSMLFLLLTVSSPVLAVFLTRRFRGHVAPQGPFMFHQAFLHTLLMGVYAAIWVALGVYVYLAYFDHGFIFDAYLNSLTDPALQAEMERLGIGRVVRTAAELDKWFAPLTANPMRLEQIRQNALAYTRRNVGATKEIMHIISDGQP